jgi:DNA-binding response OmpR family regulator
MDTRKCVLLVEPERQGHLSAKLEHCGFAVTPTASAEIALFELGERRVDVVVAARSLPGMGTAELARELRRRGTTPIVVITDTEALGRADALAVGADDHIQPTCSDRELRARLNAVIRRSRAAHGAARCVHVGELAVSVRGREVETDPPLVLTPIQAAVLGLLAEQSGSFVTEAALRQRLATRFGDDAAGHLDLDIRVLAKAIGLLSAVPHGLQHHDGLGWRLAAA